MQSNTCRLFFYPSQGSKETRESACAGEFFGEGSGQNSVFTTEDTEITEKNTKSACSIVAEHRPL